MTPAFETNSVTVYQGHVLDVLREMPDESVDCCVTSPPYWGLRDYGVAGQIGLEKTPEEYVAVMVEVFREVRRVMRKHGTLWLNLGDSYAGSWGAQGRSGSMSERSVVQARSIAAHPKNVSRTGSVDPASGLKPKDLVGIPWRVACALQADGWYLRSDIIWSKPNPMPESVTDRPTKSHEYVFLLSKSERYFFDQEAVRETGSTGSWGEMPPIGGVKQVGAKGNNTYSGNTPPSDGRRNIRSVWTIATQPYPEAHFATFPRELPERCIKAGCPEHVCSECGKARERITERPTGPTFAPLAIEDSGALPNGRGTHRNMGARYQKHLNENPPQTVGFTDCGHNAYVPGVVLDPFAGSGTTLAVARDLGRKSIGIELNPDYIRLIEKRCAQLSLEASA